MFTDNVENHLNQWGAVVFFILLYALVLLFVPFYRKVDKKPATAYLAFVIAFAIEMHGIPFSMYFISAIIGKTLPDGILWGHTLNQYIGFWGMYINIALALIAVVLIASGWRLIYKNYWSKGKGQGRLVKEGVYKYIRHPQYSGFFLLTLGMTIEWASLALLIMLPIIFFMYYRLAKREERDMVSEFGEEYVNYMKETKRFIPFIL